MPLIRNYGRAESRSSHCARDAADRTWDTTAAAAKKKLVNVQRSSAVINGGCAHSRWPTWHAQFGSIVRTFHLANISPKSVLRRTYIKLPLLVSRQGRQGAAACTTVYLLCRSNAKLRRCPSSPSSVNKVATRTPRYRVASLAGKPYRATAAPVDIRTCKYGTVVLLDEI